MSLLDRREFLAVTGAAATALAVPSPSLAAADAEPLTIIDTHTHFYDPTRPEGVPWPAKGTSLYRTVLPQHYREQKTPAPVTGTVVVEASERIEDNQWILDLAKDDPFIVGLVGRLYPKQDDFGNHVDRFGKNELFRGIRIRPDEVAAALDDAVVGCRLSNFTDRDLSIDVLGAFPSSKRVTELAKRFPKLRIVVDHMANPAWGGERTEAVKKWERWMATLEPFENVYCKVSGVVESAWRATGEVGGAPTDVEFYAPLLDHLWKVFGEDRVIYGSNWPVSDRGAPLYHVQKIVTDYFATKGDRALRKYVAGNAKVAYKWVERSTT